MNYNHTYCFYMTNGEHLMIDADDMTICDDFIKLHRNKDDKQNFMNVYKKDLMAWEVIK